MTENRMKRKKTGMIWLIFTIIWMSVIFSFSAKKAVESEGMSHSVGKEIGRLIVPQFTSWSEERQEQFAKMIDFPVRKCAHATEYAVLGVLILRTAYSFSEDSGRPGISYRISIWSGHRSETLQKNLCRRGGQSYS